MADRFDFWREQVGHTHAPIKIISEHAADFHAYQRFLQFGAVCVWPTSFQPLVFQRTPKLVRQSDPETVHVSLPRSGSLTVTHEGREETYAPHDLLVLTSSRPHELRTEEHLRRHTGVGLEVPRALLPLPPSSIDRLFGRGLPGLADNP
ncbi:MULTISPECIES: cupin domain-containing protein [unclassified Streptosporangium]|uniref:cupin domain-containing protein n=1 Tax=unclassified Streptosporangium TaxID=2632669 RepID=UPI002E2C7ABC|nr:MULTISPECIES: hypothetical protein [unclassified Streptosporangium]